MNGYHLSHIPKGELGEHSKIIEEALEFQDAMAQGCKLMALHELSDMLGAIKAFLYKHHPSIHMADLFSMTLVTKRAFESGERK